MPRAERHILVIFAAFMLILGGCRSQTPANAGPNRGGPTPPAVTPNSNKEELGLIIQMPFDVVDVDWYQDPETKKILAVLQLTPEDANQLVAEAEKLKPGEPVEISSQTWFPSELIAQNEMAGDDTLHGKAYTADVFFQPPYTSGRIARVDSTDYFVLELIAQP